MAENGREQEQRLESSEEVEGGRRTYRVSFRVAALICLGLMAGLAWALTILTSSPAPSTSAPDPGPGGGPGTAMTMPERQAEPPARLYEEAASGGLAEAVRKIDLAIIGALRESGQGLSGVRILDVRTAHEGRDSYHVQSLEISLQGGARPFRETLAAWLAKSAPEAVLRETRDGLAISVNGLVTHNLQLGPMDLPISPLPPKTQAKAKLAIVIDDLGESAAYASDLAGVGIPVAFAIWPLASQSERVAEIAGKAGMEVLLHQPMEPRSYPEDDPGQGALFTSMGEAAIRDVLVENLAHFPQAVGVNNHMGSRFTEDRRSMRAVLGELRARRLFYLDSVTTGRSVVCAEAARVGIPALRRDVFLDNVAEVDAILLQLRKAEGLAMRNGRAIAIGHPYPETLRALRAWAAQKDGRVAVVALSSLLTQESACAWPGGPSRATAAKGKPASANPQARGQLGEQADKSAKSAERAAPSPVGPQAGANPPPPAQTLESRPIEVRPLP